MAKYLVIVESPAKAKTINKFLGKNYHVVASNGHVRDLPKSQIGIDVEHDFEPKYITIRGKGDILAMLRKEVKKADRVYLATDPDREGEAISWHLAEALKLDSKTTSRISFNEITKGAVKQSIKQARDIDMDLVNAQQTRRILDRMVGYLISPILWKKVKRGLSAGRVQSVALRLICDREQEIDAFIPEEYWTLDVLLHVEGEKKPLTVRLESFQGDKVEVRSKEEMDQILKALEGSDYVINEIRRGERARKCPLPFTTSTLQQEASRKLNFSTQKTMRLAQQLYEGVEVKGSGTIGLITYLRTDSTRVSDEADANVRAYIAQQFGEKYLADGSRKAETGHKIQDAHEAIRPTYMDMTPEHVKDSLSRDLYRLYQLIWNRFVASRMQDALYETTNILITAGEYTFSVSASRLTFEGFMAVYKPDEEKPENNVLAGKITKDSKLAFASFDPKQHFTQPPAHYTEASLVRAMEELGIGRPSTYAPTITTLLSRHYITKESKNLYMTDLGEVVNNLMIQSFPSIVNTDFTANMELLLDKVGEGAVDYKTLLRNFYPDLKDAVENAEKELEHVSLEDEVSDVPCDRCGRMMVIKYGPHGKFLACPGFPECRNTMTYYEKTGAVCPKCGKDIVIRKTKKGRRYFGCIDNPNCDFMTWQRPSEEKCPECGGMLVYRGNKLTCTNSGCGFVKDVQA